MTTEEPAFVERQYGVRYVRPDREHIVGPYPKFLVRKIVEDPSEYMTGTLGYRVEMVERTVTTSQWVCPPDDTDMTAEEFREALAEATPVRLVATREEAIASSRLDRDPEGRTIDVGPVTVEGRHDLDDVLRANGIDPDEVSDDA